MTLVNDYLQSFMAASLGERLAIVAAIFALGILLRQMLRTGLPDGAAPELVASDMAALRERLNMASRRAEAAEDEARMLTGLLNAQPGPIWQRDAAGQLVFANSGFHALAEDHINALERGAPGDLIVLDAPEGQTLAAALEIGGGSADGAQGAAISRYALPADRLYATQGALKRFVETLTQTFAHLPIGLAIFDADRRLGVFNPALADLLGLDPAWLAARPHFRGVMEKLRANGKLSLGTDFQSWLDHVQAMEQNAAQKGYGATWLLPGGAALRVTGRPHLDGALAFVFEDKTQISQIETRHRTEVALGQAILDHMSEAIAVFDTTGALLLANQSFDRLWAVETGTTLVAPDIAALIARWQAFGGSGQDWLRLAAQVGGKDARQGGQTLLHHPDQGALHCFWNTMPEGSTLIHFKPPSKPANWPGLMAPLARALAPGHLLDRELPLLGEGLYDSAELSALRKAVLGLLQHAETAAAQANEPLAT